MFAIGTWIVYGNTGVCRVEDIVTGSAEKGMEDGRQYYLLCPRYQTGTIYTPTAGSKVFMRPVIDAAEAERLIDEIPARPAEAFHSKNQQELREHYRVAAESHSCGDLIGLTMSIHLKQCALEKQKRKCGQLDSRMMKHAEEMLYGEFAVALGMEKDEVPHYIEKRVKAICAAQTA